jgi:hypothetical protein
MVKRTGCKQQQSREDDEEQGGLKKIDDDRGGRERSKRPNAPPSTETSERDERGGEIEMRGR